ncbi:MAG TPA: NAD-dependent epimerase/dehydratase family protein [Nitriliruptorales bacterium]|nr:NAD-dependent epimerase/dehydratase family protein [Nitriliruptorales bacterium]
MRYLVTGGAGFIGSHLVEALVAEDHEVVVLDDLSTGRLDNLAAVRGDVQFLHGDVRDEALVARAVEGTDTVMHLAATVGVRRVVQRPLDALLANVRGAEVVLAQAERSGARALVTSTSEVYGKNPSVPLSETDDLVIGPPSVPRWTYAASKAVVEMIAMGRAREHGAAMVVARLFNTVGPRQTGAYGMVVPRFVRQAIAGEDLTVYGDGRQSRCFCAVEDVVAALLGLVNDARADGGVFNVGSDREVTVRALADTVVARTASRSRIRMVTYEQAFGSGFEEPRRRVPDTRRIRALLGWRPASELEATIDRLIEDHAHASVARSGRRGGCDP